MIARVGHNPPHLAAVVVVDVVAALADAAPLRKYCVVVVVNRCWVASLGTV